MRVALFKRFPTLARAGHSEPIAGADVKHQFPALADDIEFANEAVGPAFNESDLAAQRLQNQYRRQQVTIILGTALVSGLGGIQAVFPQQRWPGVLLILLGLVLSTVGRAEGELRAYENFLNERMRAERLRSAYFRYLSRTGPYVDDDRKRRLRRAVVAIQRGNEPK
ncbi:DUF4231 domain-containing protein [Lapillicoccus sp.]|uniref:DUF4231 domain-containing protein n=1 Tax=Lapillicoccus sp. TaxID=1909287 RepID=UPI0032637822